MAILSKDVRDMLGDAGPGTATLTGISISPGGPLTITEGSTQALVANGDFDDGTSHALTAGEGLNWTSSAPTVATVHPTNGTVTAVNSSGSTTITASVGTVSANVTVNVTPASAPAPVFRAVSAGDQFIPRAGLPGSHTVHIFCTNFFNGPEAARSISFGSVSLDSAQMASIVQVPNGIQNVPVPIGISGNVFITLTNAGGSATSTHEFTAV
ncbi:MAG: hypothetical protein BBJ57_14030 [Desulfobacterales bacterium PC51MH44]|nr:MAG: hypothetical protein BBJ57_14030 [Desulfobacterales bacterium PC51MH44]